VTPEQREALIAGGEGKPKGSSASAAFMARHIIRQQAGTLFVLAWVQVPTHASTFTFKWNADATQRCKTS
jgi:hypothetical protein